MLLRVVPVGTTPCESTKETIDELGEHFLKCKKQGRGCGHHEVKVAIQRVYGPIAKQQRRRVVNEPSMEKYKRPGVEPRKNPKTGEEVKTRADLGFFDTRDRVTILADVRTATIKAPN